jgi:hypothetical protein
MNTMKKLTAVILSIAITLPSVYVTAYANPSGIFLSGGQ